VPGFGGQQWVSSKVGAAARERKKEQQRLHKGLQAVEGRAEARRCAQPEPEAVKSAFDVLRRGAAARRRADERQDGRCGLRAILPMCANRAEAMGLLPPDMGMLVGLVRELVTHRLGRGKECGEQATRRKVLVGCVWESVMQELGMDPRNEVGNMWGDTVKAAQGLPEHHQLRRWVQECEGLPPVEAMDRLHELGGGIFFGGPAAKYLHLPF
jgi:hypothetical protein